MPLLSVTDSNFFACASIASRRLAAAKTVTSVAAAGIAAAIDSASSVTKAATRNTAVLPQSDSTGQYTGVYNDTQTQKNLVSQTGSTRISSGNARMCAR